MLRVTPDTNILVSTAIMRGKQYQLIVLAIEEKIKIVLSPEIIEEFKEVISRNKFNFSKDHISSALQKIISLAEMVIPRRKIEVIKEDNDDNRVLECAIEGKVDYIISGDPHLLNLKSYDGIKIVNTTQFLNLLENNIE